MELTFGELLALVPATKAEMRHEFIRKRDAYRETDGPTSQRFACFMLARCPYGQGMGHLLRPETLDSYDMVSGAFLAFPPHSCFSLFQSQRPAEIHARNDRDTGVRLDVEQMMVVRNDHV